MATQVLTNPSIVQGGTDMTDHGRRVALSYSKETPDDTAFGDGTRSRKPGLFDWGCEIEYYADEAANEPSRVGFTQLGTTVTLAIKPVASATSTANPAYTGLALLTNITPVEGEVGAMQMMRQTFVATGALSRATS